jgi:hypothetical protein
MWNTDLKQMQQYYEKQVTLRGVQTREGEGKRIGVGISGRRREEVKKGHGRVNIVQILCTCVCKWKNDIC